MKTNTMNVKTSMTIEAMEVANQDEVLNTIPEETTSDLEYAEMVYDHCGYEGSVPSVYSSECSQLPESHRALMTDWQIAEQAMYDRLFAEGKLVEFPVGSGIYETVWALEARQESGDFTPAEQEEFDSRFEAEFSQFIQYLERVEEVAEDSHLEMMYESRYDSDLYDSYDSDFNPYDGDSYYDHSDCDDYEFAEFSYEDLLD